MYAQRSLVLDRDAVVLATYANKYRQTRKLPTGLLISAVTPVIAATGTATLLSPYALDLANNVGFEGKIWPTSPSPGPVIEFSYEAELKNCSQMATYELVFESNPDQLKGTDWLILMVLADLFKKDPDLKIQSRATPTVPGCCR